MQEKYLDTKKPRLRLLLCPVRSGSTAFIHTIAQHPQIETATYLMKKNIGKDPNQRGSNQVDYSIYDMLSKKPYLVYKATFGFKNIAVATYDPFRNSQDIISTQPLFMFRDPVQTYNSWKKYNWGTIDLFISAYKHVKLLYDKSVLTKKDTQCISYEDIAKRPSSYFRQIFNYWNLPYSMDVVNWTSNLGARTIQFHGDSSNEMKERFCRDIKTGFYDSILNGEQKFSLRYNPIQLRDDEISLIEINLREIYNEICEISSSFC